MRQALPYKFSTTPLQIFIAPCKMLFTRMRLLNQKLIADVNFLIEEASLTV